MEVILLQDIIGLGYKNEIVDVKRGYGRNYLIPQHKAVIATDSAKKTLAENMKQQAAKIEAAKKVAEDKAKALEGIELVVPTKVSATGVAYGSVNAATVAAELEKKGIKVDRKIITMREAKRVGNYEAVAHFFKDVEVTIPVKVVAEDASKQEKQNAGPSSADSEVTNVREGNDEAERREEETAEKMFEEEANEAEETSAEQPAEVEEPVQAEPENGESLAEEASTEETQAEE